MKKPELLYLFPCKGCSRSVYVYEDNVEEYSDRLCNRCKKNV